MNDDEIDHLRAHHPALSLLRSPNVALVMSFLGRVFLDRNLADVPAGQLASGGVSRPIFAFGVAEPGNTTRLLATEKYSVDIRSRMLHHLAPMTCKLSADITLRGSSSLSSGALACPESQQLNHQRWLGRREPANTGRPLVVCR
jgi:hypothetical protein